MRAALRSRMQALTRPRAPESLPVRLDRRRVYVLPTATGLFFALLLGTMGLGALNYNNNPALLLALLLAGAAQASLLFAHLQLSGVRIEAVAAEASQYNPSPPPVPLLPEAPTAARYAAVESGEPEWLAELIRTAETDPKIFAVQSLMLRHF